MRCAQSRRRCRPTLARFVRSTRSCLTSVAHVVAAALAAPRQSDQVGAPAEQAVRITGLENVPGCCYRAPLGPCTAETVPACRTAKEPRRRFGRALVVCCSPGTEFLGGTRPPPALQTTELDAGAGVNEPGCRLACGKPCHCIPTDVLVRRCAVPASFLDEVRVFRCTWRCSACRPARAGVAVAPQRTILGSLRRARSVAAWADAV